MRSLNTDGGRHLADLRPARRASTATTAATRSTTSARSSSPAAAGSSADARVDRHQRRDAAGDRRRRRWRTGAASTTSPCSPTAAVLATGGNSSGAELVDLDNGVYTAERWNPATGTWTTLAAEQVTRQYHSTALLLPDGRVLSSGGGICGTCDAVGYLAKNAQVFSPPYLFKTGRLRRARAAPGDRVGARRASTYGDAVRRSTRRRPPSIRKVALVRLGAVTHSVNMEQRYVPLAFSAGAGDADRDRAARTPTSRRPASTCSFVVDADGVPSVARMVTIDGQQRRRAWPSPSRRTARRSPAPATIAHRRERLRRRWHREPRSSSSTARRSSARTPRRRTPITWTGVPVGSLHAHRASDRRSRRPDDERGAGRSPSTHDQRGANRLDHLAGRPRDASRGSRPSPSKRAAADSDGSVARGRVLPGTTKLGEDTTAPYSHRWKNAQSGSHTTHGQSDRQPRRRDDQRAGPDHRATEVGHGAGLESPADGYGPRHEGAHPADVRADGVHRHRDPRPHDLRGRRPDRAGHRVGVLFIAAGAGRLYVDSRRGEDER